MIYLIVLTLLGVCIMLFDVGHRLPLRAACFWGMLAVFVLLAGLRYRIGVDTVMYEGQFLSTPPLPALTADNLLGRRIEPAGILLHSLLRTVTDDFLWFQIIQAAFVNTVVFLFFRRHTPYVFTAITIYFLTSYIFLTTEHMRQAMAVAIFLLAWPALRRRRWWLYALLTVTAALFHISAIILLLFPLATTRALAPLMRPGPAAMLAASALAILGALAALWYDDIIRLLPLPGYLRQRMLLYVAEPAGGAIHQLNWKGAIPVLLRCAVYPAAALWALGKTRQTGDVFRLMQAMVMIFIYIQFFSLRITMAARMADYFQPFVITVLATAFLSPAALRPARHPAWMRTALAVPYLAATALLYTAPAGPHGLLRSYMAWYPYSSRIAPDKNYEREVLVAYCSHWPVPQSVLDYPRRHPEDILAP